MVQSPAGSGARPAKIGKGTEEEDAPFRLEDMEVEDVRLLASKETWLRWTWTVASLVAAWWIAAIFIAVVLKSTVGSPHAKHKPGPFPYPFALTAFVNAFTTPVSWILSRATERHLPAPPRMKRSEVLKILLIGCLQGLELGCNNKATEFLPVSMKTMMHSMFVLFVMISARLWGLERLGCLRCVSASFILVGGMFQGLSAEQSHSAASLERQHLHGALLMLLAMVLGAQRWALIQVVVHSACTSALGQLTKLQYSTRTLPTAGFICFIGALLFEREAFSWDAWHEQLMIAVPLVGASVIVLTLTELSVVRRTSAVALQVLATLHQIPIVVVSAVMFHEHVSTLSALGFACCILAAFVYAAARRREKLEAEENAAAEVQQEDDIPAVVDHATAECMGGGGGGGGGAGLSNHSSCISKGDTRHTTDAASVDAVELSVDAVVRRRDAVQNSP